MERAHGEAAYRMPAIDRDKCMAHIEGCMGEGFAAVVVRDGQIIGTMLGVVTDLWFSGERRASDLFTYVQPDQRHGGVGLRLYRMFRQWAHRRGTKIMHSQISG